MTEESKPHLCWTLLTWPITYKVTTISVLGVYFTWSGTETLWTVQISTLYLCWKQLQEKSSWAFILMKWTLSLQFKSLYPSHSLVYSASESLELLKHNLEAWDHTYAWLLKNSLRGIINNKKHWNSMQNKTSFLMSKQKNEALVHVVPSE